MRKLAQLCMFVTVVALVSCQASCGVTATTSSSKDDAGVGSGSPGKRSTARPLPPVCASVNLAVLQHVSNALVAVDYETRVSELDAADGKAQVDCALAGVIAVVTAGKTSGAMVLTPIEARANTMITARSSATPPAADAAAP